MIVLGFVGGIIIGLVAIGLEYMVDRFGSNRKPFNKEEWRKNNPLPSPPPLSAMKIVKEAILRHDLYNMSNNISYPLAKYEIENLLPEIFEIYLPVGTIFFLYEDYIWTDVDHKLIIPISDYPDWAEEHLMAIKDFEEM